MVRKGQGMQLSFETPIQKDNNGGFLINSVDYMKKTLSIKEKLSGSLFGLIKKFEFGEDENFSIDNLIEGGYYDSKGFPQKIGAHGGYIPPHIVQGAVDGRHILNKLHVLYFGCQTR
jgi:hypothetical protein